MEQKLYFVSGKGGVGKSTIAAAIAWNLSQIHGKRTLLVELGLRSYFKYVFPQCAETVDYQPSAVAPRLDVALWSGDRALREYITHFVKIEKLVDLFFDNPMMGAFVDAAPALRELAVLGKITSGLRNVGPKLPYDCIVVDSYATGHHLALFQAPLGMLRSMKYGPIHTESRSMLDTVINSQHSRHFLVFLPEPMPAQETFDLQQQLETDFQIRSQLILNMSLTSAIQQSQFQNDPPSFQHYLNNKTQQELDALGVFPSESVFKVPFIFNNSDWQHTLTEVSGHLGELC